MICVYVSLVHGMFMFSPVYRRTIAHHFPPDRFDTMPLKTQIIFPKALYKTLDSMSHRPLPHLSRTCWGERWTGLPWSLASWFGGRVQGSDSTKGWSTSGNAFPRPVAGQVNFLCCDQRPKDLSEVWKQGLCELVRRGWFDDILPCFLVALLLAAGRVSHCLPPPQPFQPSQVIGAVAKAMGGVLFVDEAYSLKKASTREVWVAWNILKRY